MLFRNTIFFKIKIKFQCCFFLLCFCSNHVFTQDLEPRFLSSTPIKVNIALGIYGYSSGNILTASSYPLKDLDAKLNLFSLVYARSFKLFNKLAKFDTGIPYSFGNYHAIYNNENASAKGQGFGDLSVRLSIILVGEKPLIKEDFIKRDVKKFKFGLSNRIKIPVGYYNSKKLLNPGSNRLAFQLKAASSYALSKKFIVEVHASVWLFSNNDNYFNGNSIKQDPLLTIQGHGTYIFKPGVWISGSFGHVEQGGIYLNDDEQSIPQKNSKFGLTFSYRLNKKSGLKAAFTNGLYTNIGSDFNSFLVAYNFIWFDKLK